LCVEIPVIIIIIIIFNFLTLGSKNYYYFLKYFLIALGSKNPKG